MDSIQNNTNIDEKIYCNENPLRNTRWKDERIGKNETDKRNLLDCVHLAVGYSADRPCRVD